MKCLMDFSRSGFQFRRRGVSHFYVLHRYDYVEIHDGNSETADLVGKHCSNIAPAPIISSGPSLHIKFVSDYAHQGAGFSLRYEIFKTGKLSRYCYWYSWSKIYCMILITLSLQMIKIKIFGVGGWHWVWHAAELLELKDVPVYNTAVCYWLHNVCIILHM